uniref:Acyltransferase 3 domain-containing protein n=1 Tax=Plectus sambesii TaxID=2011161 RepID=A0A914WRK0_9BILA
MPPFAVVPLLIAIAAALSLIGSVNGHVASYSETDVLRFINASAAAVSTKCHQRLATMGYFLDNQTSADRRRMFVDGFAVGPSYDYGHRDHDRWVYKALECLSSADESFLVKSKTPMHYCIGVVEKASAYSVCLPSECVDDQNNILAEWHRLHSDKHEAEQFYFENCMESRYEKQWFEQPLPLLDLIQNFMMIGFVIAATLYHHFSVRLSNRPIAKFFLAFSAKNNLPKLVQMPRDAQSTVTCFFGIRFLSMVWTVVGHSFVFYQAFVENVEEFKTDMTSHFFNQWINNFTLSVDTFLVLSGTLTAYSWFQKWQKNSTEEEPTWRSWGYWLRFYRHRVVRLWPAYAYMLLAITSRLSVTHYHQMWPLTDPSVQCPKRWWQNLLFLNSLFDDRCMPWTWYIGTEFIFYLLSPIFLLALRKRATFGVGLAAIVMGVSIGLRAATILAYNFPPTQMLFKQPAMFNPDFIEHHLVIYVKPHTRIGSYLVGILLGYFLATGQKRQHVEAPSPLLQTVGWFASAVAGGWALFGLYPALQEWDWPIYHLVYGSIHRTVFAIAIAWLIYACHTGMGGPVNALLSHRCFIPLSSLCYGVYLFHMLPVLLTFLIETFPLRWTTQWPLFCHCFFQLCFAYVTAFILAMIVELPVLNIEKLLLSKASSLPKKQSEMTLRRDSSMDSSTNECTPSVNDTTARPVFV